MAGMKLYHGYYLIVTALIIFFDQLSKLYILSYLLPYEPVSVNAFFNLVLVFNTGAAFSLLAHVDGWQSYFLIGIAVFLSIGIVYYLCRFPHIPLGTALGLSCVLGGAIGNLLDRVRYGYVIDFLQLHIREYYWPVFNLADSAITVGVCCLLIEVLRSTRSEHR